MSSIRKLKDGLSGADIYTDGNLVYKTANNSDSAYKWFSYVQNYLNIPKISKVVANTITMEYIRHDKTYLNLHTHKALNLIQDQLEKMSKLDVIENGYIFNDYVKRIEMHVKLAKDIPEFANTFQKLKEIKLKPTFSHGDFGVRNMLFKGDQLYLIDPNLDTFGCTKLDVAKFIASLYTGQSPIESKFHEYNSIAYLASRLLCDYNNFEKDILATLIKSEIIRIYKYHPNKQFILNKVQQVEADFL